MLDKQKMEMLSGRLNKMLENEFADDPDFRLQIGRVTYTDTTATFKVELSTVTEDGSVMDKTRQDFERLAWRYQLKPEDFGKTFSFNRKEYKIVGLKPRGKKYPILAEAKDGKLFKFPIEVVKSCPLGDNK